MEKLKSLQELINEKAEYRLNQEVAKAAASIFNSDLLRPTDNPGLPDVSCQKEDGSYITSQKPYWFFQTNSVFFAKVKAYWLPIYIAEETERFVKKVEELETDIQELKNVQYAADY